MRSLLILILTACTAFAKVPRSSEQCVVGISSSWDSSYVTLNAYEKQNGKWVLVKGPIKGRLGRTGMAWGLGLHTNPKGVTAKREGDGKAPAGIFSIGGAWGYDASIKKNPKLPYRQITKRDLWVEDSNSAFYNSHMILPKDPTTPWENKQQMRQNDHAHSLKLFIGHNAPPKPTPGAGSAIFFHIWRAGGNKPTAGCTTMPEDQLRSLIAWINPDKNPVYVLLPKAEYEQYQSDWKLP